MKKLFTLIALTLLITNAELVFAGKCTGSSNCRSCHNCSKCKHCNAGGTCGVCKPNKKTK